MDMTSIAERTGWTPDQVDGLPWRYRERLVSCLNLLGEVRRERDQ